MSTTIVRTLFAVVFTTVVAGCAGAPAPYSADPRDPSRAALPPRSDDGRAAGRDSFARSSEARASTLTSDHDRHGHK